QNNKGNTCGVLMLTLFLFAFAGQCKSHILHLLLAYYSLTNATVDAERKLVIKFCTEDTCKGNVVCYCCETRKPYPKCYSSRNKCEAACSACNPKCP
ncbi:hypothetical protein BS78_06G011700, partial [Paspalum vaginatum]